MATSEIQVSSPRAQMLESRPQQSPTAVKQNYIWIVAGPGGCGKSSIALHLAEKLSVPYIEGDELHPPANIAKMARGEPLNDDDRWDWLATLRNSALEKLQSGSGGCVVTCSCLKRKYRDVLRKAGTESGGNVAVRFIYLKASEETLLERVRERENHYFKENMVHSQFQALEEPTADEIDVIAVDCSVPKNVLMATALDKVERCLKGE